jgi:hypothetical protein
LGFVLHLGDFVYEIVWYPEDRPQGYYARRIRDIVRYSSGEKHADFHVPTTVEDYRSLYRAYLLDPDLQDARARWPFICMPDNHEFSWKGWQTQENFGAGTVPAQTRKVAANQAWFEYQPARVARVGATAPATSFHAPSVANRPLTTFDANGLGLEASNLAAVDSLKFFLAIAADLSFASILLVTQARRQRRFGWIVLCGAVAVLVDVQTMLVRWFPCTAGWPVITQVHALHFASAGDIPASSWLLGTMTQVITVILAILLLLPNRRDG